MDGDSDGLDGRDRVRRRSSSCARTTLVIVMAKLVLVIPAAPPRLAADGHSIVAC
jgi:hypothetical protein